MTATRRLVGLPKQGLACKNQRIFHKSRITVLASVRPANLLVRVGESDAGFVFLFPPKSPTKSNHKEFHSMQKIKAIETAYNGYRFRSRLEARYAVLFDTVGLKYEYEKEGFELDEGRYLPDFWLPENKIWLEIKGIPPSDLEVKKSISLCRETKRDVAIAVGDLEAESTHYLYNYHWLHPQDLELFKTDPKTHCGGEDILNKIIEKGYYILCPHVFTWQLLAAIGLNPEHRAGMLQIMRSARFEHGESGV
jgi:hypothetical protein